MSTQSLQVLSESKELLNLIADTIFNRIIERLEQSQYKEMFTRPNVCICKDPNVDEGLNPQCCAHDDDDAFATYATFGMGLKID